MKVIVTTVVCSCALAGFEYSTFAQARGGGAVSAGPGVGASAGVGSSAVSGSTSPSGNLARGAQSSGTITPSGTLGNVGTGVTGSSTPVGPLNPGGITGIPPQSAGRTFDRSIIGGAPADTVVDPANPQAPFRFPPTSRTLQPYATQNDLVEPTATPNTGAFAPVAVGNTVGANVGDTIPARPVEPVTINLPPGARIATNIGGVPEIVVPAPGVVTASGSVATNGVVPAPGIIATNAVGRGPTFETSTGRSVTPGQRIPSQGGRLD